MTGMNIHGDDATLFERALIEHIDVPLGDVIQGSVSAEVVGGEATIRWSGARVIPAAELQQIFNTMGVRPAGDTP